jgi:hypothetical protein
MFSLILKLKNRTRTRTRPRIRLPRGLALVIIWPLVNRRHCRERTHGYQGQSLASVPSPKSLGFRPAEAGPVGCFSRRSEPGWRWRRAYLDRYVRSEQRGKTANRPRPRGLRWVGEASRFALFRKGKARRFAYTALPAAHFERNETQGI